MEPPQHWPRWPQPWPRPSPEHSTHLEGRLKDLEHSSEDHRETIAKHANRLTWHERALQALALAVWFLLNGKAHGEAGSIADVLLSIAAKALR